MQVTKQQIVQKAREKNIYIHYNIKPTLSFANRIELFIHSWDNHTA